MISDWEPFPGNETYEVSPYGQVRNATTGEVRKPSINQGGVMFLSLYDKETGRYRVKSIAVIVAETFVHRDNPKYETVVHVDGNKGNCCASNLIWRDRYFAVNYHKQINGETSEIDERTFFCVDTGEEFDSVFELAKELGTLPERINRSIFFNNQIPMDRLTGDEWWSRTIVWPGGRAYRSTLY